MAGKIARQLDFPSAKEVSCVVDVGNNGNALVFFQLEELLTTMTAPARALAVAIESSKWIKAGLALEREAM
ncbi:hypothetical protein ACFQ1S_21815 [Kibdelosporangium lantanae]|uniref:Uncharacterized protein n=1 Tax=Kibdelosporangium lantanae TaxID=1497396 RepID=A0ABW3MED3_9PSEU